MLDFNRAMEEKMAIFTPFLSRKIEISSTFFLCSRGTVAEFVAEMAQTSQLISQETDPDYAAFHSHRLIEQFDCLKKVVDKFTYANKKGVPTYKSRYQFARNLHNLPKDQKLAEYNKALRALNEKLSWLIEQNYASENPSYQAVLQGQIQETEYRKQKCLAAIQALI